MGGAEQRRALDEDRAEAARALRLDRKHERGGAGVVVDEDVGRADLGESVAAAAELGLERRLGGGDLHRVDRVLGGDVERLAQRRRVGSGGRVEARQADLGEAVERAGLDVERDREGAAGGGVDAGGDRGVVIAAGAHQLGEQVGVGAGAAIDLRRIGRIAAIFLERGQSAELGQQRDGVDVAEALDRIGVGPRRRRLAEAGVGDVGDLAVGRFDVGPVDAEIGPGVERRRRIERLVDFVHGLGRRGRGRRRRLRGRRGAEKDEGNGSQGGCCTSPRNDLQHASRRSGPSFTAPERNSAGISRDRVRAPACRQKPNGSVRRRRARRSVDGVQVGPGAEQQDQALDLPPAAEMEDVAEVAAAVGAKRRLARRIFAEAGHQIGRVGCRRPVGKVNMKLHDVSRSS